MKTTKQSVRPERKVRKPRLTEQERNELYNGDSDIDKVMHGRKIKYEVLNKLFDGHLPKKQLCNIFIDVHSLLKKLYIPVIAKSFDNLSGYNKFVISSQLLNIAAHYRHYFVSRKQMYTNIYFYYSMDKAEKLVAEHPVYRSSFYTKHIDKNFEYHNINKVVAQNLELCKLISDYIPHVYFINTKKEDYNIVPYHFLKEIEDSGTEDEFSIIYTDDKIQAINASLFKDTYILTPNSDKSKLYYQDSLINFIIGKDDEDYMMFPPLLQYSFGISGYNKYDVSGWKSYGHKRAIDYMIKQISAGNIRNIEYGTVNHFIEDLVSNCKIDEEKQLQLEKTYKLLSPKFNYSRLTDVTISNIFTTSDLIDKASLTRLNSYYYDKHPIMLDELMEGEEYE